jgi:hypothetical protein
MGARPLHTTLRPGDRIRLRKTHPCGSDLWEVMRLGADVRLKCVGCGRMLSLPRAQLHTALRAIVSGERETGADPPTQ